MVDLLEEVARGQAEVLAEVGRVWAEWGAHAPEPDRVGIVFVRLVGPRFPIREEPPAIM